MTLSACWVGNVVPKYSIYTLIHIYEYTEHLDIAILYHSISFYKRERERRKSQSARKTLVGCASCTNTSKDIKGTYTSPIHKMELFQSLHACNCVGSHVCSKRCWCVKTWTIQLVRRQSTKTIQALELEWFWSQINRLKMLTVALSRLPHQRQLRASSAVVAATHLHLHQTTTPLQQTCFPTVLPWDWHRDMKPRNCLSM